MKRSKNINPHLRVSVGNGSSDPKSSTRQLAIQSKNPVMVLAVGIFIGAIVVGTAVLVWKHDEPSRSYPLYRIADAPRSVLDTRTPPTPALDPAMTRVAARFACSCGTCGEKRLDICTCPTAEAERAFLQDQLRNGRTEAEAAEALNKKYGGLKS